MVSLIVGARFAGVEPSQSVKLILTGMVLLYLNTLVPSALMGGRKPLVLKFTVKETVMCLGNRLVGDIHRDGIDSRCSISIWITGRT